MPNYPSEKPRDASGTTIPHDHGDIAVDEFLVRGVTKHSVRNNRISKSLFKSSTDPYKGLSVDLERLALTKDYTSDKFIGAVKLAVRAARDLGLFVGYDPVLDENLAHCQIWNPPNPSARAIGTSNSKQLCSCSEWHTEVPNVAILSYAGPSES